MENFCYVARGREGCKVLVHLSLGVHLSERPNEIVTPPLLPVTCQLQVQPKEGLTTPAQTSGSSMLGKPAFPLPAERQRIFPGGYKTNEDYVYVRGRGRGRYDVTYFTVTPVDDQPCFTVRNFCNDLPSTCSKTLLLKPPNFSKIFSCQDR